MPKRRMQVSVYEGKSGLSWQYHSHSTSAEPSKQVSSKPSALKCHILLFGRQAFQDGAVNVSQSKRVSSGEFNKIGLHF